MGSFKGFSEETFAFLMELAFNNNKEFFEKNRDRYIKYVKEPLSALAVDIIPTALELDPQFNQRLSSVISRIYRDTRFSKDKSPYRDHMWLGFKREGQSNSECFGMYFEIAPTHYAYGCGMYGPNKPLMDAIKSYALNFPNEFSRIINDKKLKRIYKVCGEDYKKNIIQAVPESIAEWVNKKYFYLQHVSTYMLSTMSEELVDELKEGFLALKDLYSFVLRSQSTV